MDKKKEMMFNLNNFLLAFSDILNSKKAVYIALNLALKYDFSKEKLSDLVSYSIVSNLNKEQIQKFSFNNQANLKDEKLLLIVKFSQKILANIDFSKDILTQKKMCENFLEINYANFDKTLVENFMQLSQKLPFWLDLQNNNEILLFIYSKLDDFTKVLSFEEILIQAEIFHKFVDKDSKLLSYADILTDYFAFEHKDKQIFLIASALHNIGKLALTTKIDDLNKTYSYYTKIVLNQIMGFADICNLAYKSGEYLDGSGIFYLLSKDLSFKDRLLICLVIYSNLRDDKKINHQDVIKIMETKTKEGKIDKSIVEVFETVLS